MDPHHHRQLLAGMGGGRPQHVQVKAILLCRAHRPGLAGIAFPAPVRRRAGRPPAQVAHRRRREGNAQEPAHAAGDDACELLPPHVVPVGGAGDPPALDMLNRYMQFPLADDQQILFAHALTTAAGDRRLVIAQFGPDPRPAPAGFQRLASELLVIVPATWSDPPRVLTRQRVAAADVRLGYAGTVCYAGQPDGPDAFWLTIDQQRERHRLRGVLQPDGKHVALAAVDRAPLP